MKLNQHPKRRPALLPALLLAWFGMLTGAQAQLSWQSVTSYPIPIDQTGPVVYNGRIYMVSGDTGINNFVPNAYFASLNPNGTLGSWTATTPLPVTDPEPSVVAYNGFIYVIPSRFPGTIYQAVINADGSLGAWQSSTWPGHGGGLCAEVFNSRLYVLGGNSTSVHYSQINLDGSLGPWISQGNLPAGDFTGSVHFTTNRVYVAGGYPDTANVFSAPISGDGTLGNWRTEAPLPGLLREQGRATIGNTLYVFGGLNNYVNSTNIYYAVCNPTNGAISQWNVFGTMPTLYASIPGVIFSLTNASFYVVGGRNYPGGPTSQVWQSFFGPPTILQSPTNQAIPTNSTAIFNVVASSHTTLFYQWYFNVTNLLAAQTNATLILTNVTVAQVGAYSVIVSNSAGSLLSSPAFRYVDIADTDRDGIPNYGELQYGLNPTN